MAQPNLRFTAALITAHTANGVEYSYTLKNNGPGHIPGLAHLGIQCYYSANTVYGDAGDVAAGGGPIGVNEPLAAGASRTLTDYAVGAPPAGKPYLVFKVDESGALFETNEGNNTRALRVTP